jgi:5-formyltetrahydrofolate cyclo-ligase
MSAGAPPDEPDAGRGESLRDAKRALRERIVGLREALPAATRASASQAIARRIAALASFERARCVILTLPYRSEWDARLLMRHALADGKSVAVPRVDTAARMLRALIVEDPDHDVEPGYRGIPEPCASCREMPRTDIDWVLVPGIAFDAAGRRLGYGGGFYDRLLPLLRAAAPRIAGAFDVQIVEAVPAAAHDIGVDCVVTESRTLQRP